MKIIVCIKQVPGTTNVALDPETGTMKRDGTRGRLNPFDLFAIEQALQLRESYGGTVTVLSMGPTQAETSLKEALYMGADDAYLICDKAMIGSDVLATSRAISQAIQYIGNPDLVLCGKQTIDGDTAQVGPEVAEMLDIPHLTNVVCFEKYDDCRFGFRARRKYISIEIAFPCLYGKRFEYSTTAFISMHEGYGCMCSKTH